VPDLDDRQGRLLARPVTRPRWARRGRRSGRRSVENRRAGLLQRLLDGKRQLRDVGQAPQARELGGQLEILGNEALILALEEQALPQRIDVAFLGQGHHDAAQ
jgi:hypothetical protein